MGDQTEKSNSLTLSSSAFKTNMNYFETHLSNAVSVCKSNYKFDFLSMFAANSHSSPCMMGIDEAGRGPVLGPMVYACAVSGIDFLDELKNIGLADSKTLSEQQRENLLEEMLQRTNDIVGCVHVISPVFITEKMLDKFKTNLNTISHDAAIGLIQTVLDHGVNLVEVYVDTVGKAENYQAKLESIFPHLRICVESKADDTYPIVSAASIFAKVTRDRILQMWPTCERGPVSSDVAIGSGYPGDPATKAYLRACMDTVFGFPSLVRSSWSTASNLLDHHGVPVTWEDDENIESNIGNRKVNHKQEYAKTTTKLTKFFGSQSKSPIVVKKLQRQPFFVKINLNHVQNLI